MKEIEVYAVKHQDERVVAASRSGGGFTALSDALFQCGGVVYGCVLNDAMEVVHIRAEGKQERNQMRGSKYVQSRLGDTFRTVKADLVAGKPVLFTGTACQVAGLRNFLGTEYDQLICVDIVCHGVPSPLVWKSYLCWQEKRTGRRVVGVDFRNKSKFGWREHIETLTLEDGKQIDSKIYTKLFYGHSILRPSCYECPYKSVTRPGDITIADYWGIEKAAPELDDNKGVSLVLINTEKGRRAFETVKPDLRWVRTRLEDSMQPPLKAPFPKPEGREQFWKDFRKKEFSYVAKRYAEAGILPAVREHCRAFKRRVKKIIGK